MRQVNTLQLWFWSHHWAQHSCVYSRPRRWNSWRPSYCYSSGGVLQQQRLKQEAADQTWPAPSLCSEGGLTEDSSEAQIKEICLFNWLQEIELGRRWRKGNIAQSAVAWWRNERTKSQREDFPPDVAAAVVLFTASLSASVFWATQWKRRRTTLWVDEFCFMLRWTLVQGWNRFCPRDVASFISSE